MEYDAVSLTRLVEQFAALPGIGRKTAQRLSFYLLARPEGQIKEFANALLEAYQSVKHCKVCRNLTDQEVCAICNDKARDDSLVCVVEDAKDVVAFERTREYHGKYHVLHGLISPMDGIGPDQLFIKELLQRVAEQKISEVILATNPTVEGEATAMYLQRLLKPFGVVVSRLAFGLPIGSNLEYADEVTLFKALQNRNVL